MDLSEFKPPVRLSMSDEEIYQALGAAQATEDGLAKAMAIVEEQANLREHDNQLFNEWVARMQASEAPEAKIALENVERAKQGLPELPLQPAPVEDIAASLNAAYTEPIVEEPVVEELVVEEIVIVEPEIVVEESLEDDPFEALLEEAATEATSSIVVPVVEKAPSEETFESAIEDFTVSADEDALVVEERVQTASKSSSNWWGAASFWAISVGLVLPVVAAFLVALQAISFGTALVGFGLGLLLNLGLIVSNHFTAVRSSQPAEVTRRATFGVFGAILPGLFSLKMKLVSLALVVIAAVVSFNGSFTLNFAFSDEVLPSVSVGFVITVALVVVAFAVAAFAGRFLRWVNASVALIGVVAFVAVGLLTRSAIDFSAIQWNIDFAGALLVAAFVALAAVALNGAAPEERANTNLSSKPWLRWSAIGFAAFVLPLAVFGHFFLVYKGTVPNSGFDQFDVIIRLGDQAVASPVLWCIAAVLLVLASNLANASLIALRAFSINRIRWWMAAPLLVAVVICIYFFAEWSTWIDAGWLLVGPAALVAGFTVSDALLRRGEYHEASLLRSYGFYGPVNLTSVIGFAVLAAGVLAITPANSTFVWLGFAGWTTPFASLIAFGAALVFGLATSIPRIKKQQHEVSEVELRKASLNAFPGFGE